MNSIDYIRPTTVDEALSLLTKYKDKARLLAGGTDLIVQMRGGRYQLDAVIDAKHIEELNQLTFNNQDGLVIGAAVPCHKIYGDEKIAQAYPGIMDSATLIGGIQIQGRATLGGNLMNAAPSADAIPTLIAHNAVANIVSSKGTRAVPVEEICSGPGRTNLATGELLVSISVPAPSKGFGGRYIRFIPRNEMDIAVAAVASSILVGADGKISEARIALASVGPTPIFAKKASNSLIGKEANEASFKEAAAIAKSECSPIEDMRGTIEQRKHLVEVITLRTLNQSLERIEG